eukprot:SAG31_NODE_2353_length_5881_cov_20.405742_2_plen_808_part_01
MRPFRCLDDQFDSAAAAASAISGCEHSRRENKTHSRWENSDTCNPCVRCGTCVECEQGELPILVDGFVRVVGVSSMSDIDGLIMPCPGETVAETCHQQNTSSVGIARCLPDYTGHFCKSCSESAFMQNGVCVKCSETSLLGSLGVMAGVFVVVIGVAVLVWRWANNDRSRHERHTIVAITKSMWQPLRILITYAQAIAEVDTVLNFSFPPYFESVLHVLQLVNFTDLMGVQCIGLGTFDSKWLFLVAVQPPVVMGILCVRHFLATKYTEQNNTKVKADSRGYAFFVLFILYPMLCRVSLDAWNCTSPSMSPTLEYTVLVADDRVSCESGGHDLIQYLSVAVIVSIGVAVPVCLCVLVYRSIVDIRNSQGQEEDGFTREVYSKIAFELGLEDATSAAKLHEDVQISAPYSVLVDTYTRQFFYWEGLDMIRKLCLAGFPLLFRKSPSLPVLVLGLVAVIFVVVQSEGAPYKAVADNSLRSSMDHHVVAVAAISSALAADTGMDADGDDGLSFLYDMLLVSSFLLLVVFPFLGTLLSKVIVVHIQSRLVIQKVELEKMMFTEKIQTIANAMPGCVRAAISCLKFLHLLSVDEDSFLASEAKLIGKQKVVGDDVRMAHARFRWGLASVHDKKMIKAYFSLTAEDSKVAKAFWNKFTKLPLNDFGNELIHHFRDAGLYSDKDIASYIGHINDIVREGAKSNAHEHEAHVELYELCRTEGIATDLAEEVEADFDGDLELDETRAATSKIPGAIHAPAEIVSNPLRPLRQKVAAINAFGAPRAIQPPVGSATNQLRALRPKLASINALQSSEWQA